MPSRIPRLTWNDTTHEKLEAHRLNIDLALEVVRNRPELFHQKSLPVLRPDGSVYDQPDRLRMVGPDRLGRLLTFILELPDRTGHSHIVTGWYSGDRDARMYRQRRRNR